MKKLISIFLAIFLLVSCAGTAFAADSTPEFTYKLSLTDEAGNLVNNVTGMKAGDKLNIAIDVTRTDITEDSYEAYVVEFKLTTNGLTYNNDGVSFREGTSVNSVWYSSGRVTGVTYLDLGLQGETVSNPLRVASWSYTVEDPAEVTLAVTTAIVYVAGHENSGRPVELVDLMLNGNNGSFSAGAEGEYAKGAVVTLPNASRSGYTFKGWSDGTTVYPAGTKLTLSNSMHLEAQWEEQYIPRPPVVVPDPPVVEPEVPEWEPPYEVENLVTDRHINYINGYSDGTIRPENPITRAEAATIFYRLLNAEYRNRYQTTVNNFTDVAEGSWYNTAISTLANAGILTGYPDGSFGPNRSITRAEVVVLIDRFASAEGGVATFFDVGDHWARDSIGTSQVNGWVSGYPDGSFKPNNPITRAETFALVNHLLGRYVNNVNCLLPEMETFIDNMNTAKWYYFDVQEAANNHEFKRVDGTKYEEWVSLPGNIVY